MLKNIVALEHKVEDRIYQLQCHGVATWGEIHDALWKMKEFALAQINANHKKQSEEDKGEPQDEHAAS